MAHTTDEKAQTAVIAFLGASSTHGGAAVERISTHGAHVFLAGPLAFKLKRAVKLSFLDFSTVEHRRHALETEFAINQATASALYREIRAIRRGPDGEPQFGGEGTLLDWVLVMNRFDQADLLDAMASRGAITAKIVDDLADVVVEMHRHAPPVERDEAAYFTRAALNNLMALRDPRIEQGRVGRLAKSIADRCGDLAAHLNTRVSEGLVRRSHGDLHLRNIVMIDGRPTPFDALEFDSELATGDVFFDLAFLLMDLQHRGLSAHAHRLFDRYVSRSDDIAGLRALPLFLAVRATIRAKVGVLAAADADEDKQRALIGETEQYLELAERYLTNERPRLVAIGGLSGTGKSTVARSIAHRLRPAPGALILRSDVIRKRLFGVEEAVTLPQSAYTPEVGDRVYAALVDKAARSLAAGYSCIVDAVSANPKERAALAATARERGCDFRGFWLHSSIVVRAERVGDRKGDASDATAAVARAQESYEIGPLDWVVVDADGTLQEVVRKVERELQLQPPNRVD